MEKRHPNHPGELSANAEQAAVLRDPDEIGARARAIEVLQNENVPFLVGGAYAYAQYTGIYRDTKDLDLFPRKADALRALKILDKDGWRTERTDETWIYKAFKGEYFVDFIFSSGNGVAVVDDEWFEHSTRGHVFGHECDIAPPEEMIWSKSFVCERERYDGADVIHIIKSVGKDMDWNRMFRRFDRYWEVLFSHLMMYRFAYPCERTNVPDWVMAKMLERTVSTMDEGNWSAKICRGNLVSRVNYGLDINDWGYVDGRRWDEVEREKHQGDDRGDSRSGFEVAHSGGR